MKHFRKIIPIISLILFIFLHAGLTQTQAQSISEWRVGVSVDRTSVDFNRGWTGLDIFIEPETGFSAIAQPVFKINEDISFVTGIEYTYFKYRLPSLRAGGATIEEAGNPHISYLSLPLKVKLHHLENLRYLIFTAGFRISTRIGSSDGIARITQGDTVTESPHLLSELSNDVILGVTFGIGYRLPGNMPPLSVDLIYNQDITPFYNLFAGTDTSLGVTRLTRIDLWRRSVGLRLSYHF